MKPNSIQKPILLMVIVAVSAMVISRLLTSNWLISDHPNAMTRFLQIIWINFLFELTMIAFGVYLVYRVILRDRVVRRQQSRHQNLAELALMSGGLVHEARNHIHAMKPHLALIRKRADDAEKVRSRVSKLESVADDLEKLLNDFLIFARPAEDNSQDVDIVQLAKEVVDIKQPDLSSKKIMVHLEHQKNIPNLLVDRPKIRSALLNLILNASQAIEREGNIWVRLTRQRGKVLLVVEDDGCGISESDRSMIFQSFFTTKGEGIGLGLAVVQRTIQDMGGSINVESTEGQGARFTIELPIKRAKRKQPIEPNMVETN